MLRMIKYYCSKSKITLTNYPLPPWRLLKISLDLNPEYSLGFEPRHDKTNKVSVCPAKTQISLGIRPVWSVFAVRSMGSQGPKLSSCAQRRLIRLGECPGWSESSLGAHSFCWFCHVAAHVFHICFCLFVLGFYGPVNNKVMSSRSVNGGTVPGQA